MRVETSLGVRIGRCVPFTVLKCHRLTRRRRAADTAMFARAAAGCRYRNPSGIGCRYGGLKLGFNPESGVTVRCVLFGRLWPSAPFLSPHIAGVCQGSRAGPEVLTNGTAASLGEANAICKHRFRRATIEEGLARGAPRSLVRLSGASSHKSPPAILLTGVYKDPCRLIRY